jgi:nitrate reductase gamma subunit
MDPFSYLVSGIGVYVGVAVLVVGLAWRSYQWMSTPRSAVPLGMYPKPAGAGGRFVRLLRDSFIAPQSAEIEPRMWLFAFAFHLALFGAFVGHLRLIHEFTPLAARLGEGGMNRFAALSGGIVGIVMLVSIVYWLGRRTYGPFKILSVPEDYALLALLLGIVLMGDHMRFFGHLHADTYRAWFTSVLALRPAFPPDLAASQMKWSLDAHMLFVDLLFIYFPFSKLVHTVGTFATNLIRSE